MNHQKGYSSILLVLGILLIIGLAYIGFNLKSNTNNLNNQSVSIKSTQEKVPAFSSGKIAFIKSDGNVFVASKNGDIKQITKDATDKISDTFNYPLQYRGIFWSPLGDKFAFQQSFNYTKLNKYLISDGTSVMSDEALMSYSKLPPYWLSNDKIMIADYSNGTGSITTSTLKGIKWNATNATGDPYFSKFNTPDGCGGGGRPDWSNKLSWNHFGEMDGVRSTFLYVKDQHSMIYSTSCENELVEKVATNGTISVFDSSNKRSSDFKDVHHTNAPQELQLSPDQDKLVGTLNGNVVLYSLSGKLEKTLTTSGKAYGPVFGKDNNTIYYADDLGDKPTLKKVAIVNGKLQTLYTGKFVGAISNINLSPDNKQVLFTLIQEEKVSGPPDDQKATQDVYLIYADGTYPTLFLKNASQAVWSPQ